jgi:PEP-CTERM motif
MSSLLSKSFLFLRGLIYSAAFVWLWAWLAISVRSFDQSLPVSLPLWLHPIGFVLASAGAFQLTEGGFSTPSNVLSGTATVDIGDTGITVQYAGQAQPGEIVFDFTNVGTTIVGESTSTSGIMNGVNMALTPSFTASSVTGMGFFLFGFQPATDVTQTAALSFGTTPVPEPDAIVLLGAGLLALVGLRRSAT